MKMKLKRKQLLRASRPWQSHLSTKNAYIFAIRRDLAYITIFTLRQQFRIRTTPTDNLWADELTRRALCGVHEFFRVVASNEVVGFNLSVVWLRVSAQLRSVRTAWVKPAT